MDKKAEARFWDKVDRKGEEIGNVKLSEIEVREIVKRYETGEFSYRQLAKVYQVNHTLISKIVNRKCWKHLWTERGIACL